MTGRERQIAAFLAAAGWARATRQPLAGDASTRRYERLSLNGKPAVLMDADPAQGQDIARFIAVAGHLAGLGLSTPAILAADEPSGLALLEDFGDTLFARLVAKSPGREPELYAAATDLLAELATAPIPAFLNPFEPGMAAAVAPAFDWYQRGIDGTTGAREACIAVLAPLIDSLDLGRCLIHRDYHAENLFWLPGRDGLARVGLIDFQDSLAGPVGYDLISLLEDARRAIAPETDEAMRVRFCAALGLDRTAFDRAAAVLGLQRNLRILGIFARLCLHAGKAHYLAMMPRIWGHIRRDLEHSALAGVRETLACLPEPTPVHIDQLKARCGSVPTP